MKTNANTSLIYLVDDDPIFLTLIQRELSTMSKIKTKVFSSGESCLKQMHKNPFMVVLDYELTGDTSDLMNGVEVLKRIKETNPETEVIMLLGSDDVIIAVESIRFGVYDYVVKNESALVNVNNRVKNSLQKLRLRQGLRREDV